MKKKRFSGEQITAVLQQVEDGVPVGDVCRQVGVSEQRKPVLSLDVFHARVRRLKFPSSHARLGLTIPIADLTH